MISSSDDLRQYFDKRIRSARFLSFGVAVAVALFFCFLAYFSDKKILYLIALLAGLAAVGSHFLFYKTLYKRAAVFSLVFPESWRQILNQHVVFYRNLNFVKRELFEKRIQLFMSEKRVEAIDMEINDEIRLLVAASAVIPTFAFPLFNYPHLHEVLVYPASFSRKFEIGGNNTREQNIEGMVGNGYMNHSLLLSAPALLAGFTGREGEENVGIHEFVHLLDREDGETDGLPERLMKHAYTIPWLRLIKEEMSQIRKGRSDINPYAITNNAEFLAVVSEYFFNDPEEFQEKHPELYSFLSMFYNQKL